MNANNGKRARRTKREYAKYLPELIQRRALFQSWEQIAREMSIPEATLRRNYKLLMEDIAKEGKGISEELIQEYVERAKIVIKKSLAQDRYGLASSANNALFDRLQSIGRIPKVKESLELSGEVKTGLDIDDLRELYNIGRERHIRRQNLSRTTKDSSEAVQEQSGATV